MAKSRAAPKQSRRMQRAVSAKIQKNLHEMHLGHLRSGSKRGPRVTNPRQAIAIAEAQARRRRRK